jgi:dTDP-4-dehydrorhamnose 3,5-epimerase
MIFEKMGIEGAWITHSQPHSDVRGTFKEWFRSDASLRETKFEFNVKQSNVSTSKIGVIRGIHYSLHPSGQWKWITCVSGSVFDVVVDIRPDSPTFKSNRTVNLSEHNGLGVLIQGNLGHAFQAQSENAIVAYNLNSVYAPEYEYEINPLDDSLKIEWPISDSIISAKDLAAPSLDQRKSQLELPSL